jgi:hypothetical protein
MRRDLARCELLVADERQDLAAVRRGDRPESSFHGCYLSNYLRKCQLTP